MEGDYPRMSQVFLHDLVQVRPGIWDDGWKARMFQVFSHKLDLGFYMMAWMGTILGCPRYSHTTWYKSDLGVAAKSMENHGRLFCYILQLLPVINSKVVKSHEQMGTRLWLVWLLLYRHVYIMLQLLPDHFGVDFGNYFDSWDNPGTLFLLPCSHCR